ncbi:MAG: hypothetical protein ACRC2T_06000, partial [Thermoguttaceae bacterium]
GTKWTATSGRVLPFTGYKTEYEVVGFAEVANRKTVNVKFTGAVPNVISVSGQSLTNTHSGNAYFDIDTGLLVRQETELTPTSKGVVPELSDLTAKGRFVLQFFVA